MHILKDQSKTFLKIESQKERSLQKKKTIYILSDLMHILKDQAGAFKNRKSKRMSVKEKKQNNLY